MNSIVYTDDVSRLPLSLRASAVFSRRASIHANDSSFDSSEDRTQPQSDIFGPLTNRVVSKAFDKPATTDLSLDWRNESGGTGSPTLPSDPEELALVETLFNIEYDAECRSQTDCASYSEKASQSTQTTRHRMATSAAIAYFAACSLIENAAQSVISFARQLRAPQVYILALLESLTSTSNLLAKPDPGHRAACLHLPNAPNGGPMPQMAA